MVAFYGWGSTASRLEQLGTFLFYLNAHFFATIVSIQGIWEVGGRYTPTPYPPTTSFSTSRNGMR